MMSRQSSLVLSLSVGLIGSLALGCSSSPSGSGAGGNPSQGGNNQGGSSATGGGAGGKNTGAGGSSAGGSSAGGSSAGGSSAGGSKTGGSSAGGSSAGGSSAGGSSAGGSGGKGGAGGSSAGGAGGSSGAGGTSAGGAGGSSVGGAGGSGTSGGTGGTGAGGTSAGTGTPLGECTSAGTVSNFDDGTMAVRDVAKSGLTGALWDAYKDATSGTIKLAVEDGGSGTCGAKALHITGSGFSDWGAGVEFILGGTFAPGKSQAKPVDMSAYVGMRFKAKIGSAHKNPVRIQISTPETEDKKESSGKCDPAVEGDDACYNHMGKFFWTDSDNPGLSMPMSSSWKDYTFCFDRDLFPKWLPSNLSAEQRRNIAKNFLKFQVDFNKSLDVANNAIDTSTAKLHAIGDAFDLWLDDVEFITDAGLCTNYPVSSSWKPVGKAGGSCAMAPEASKFYGYIDALYTHWKAKFLSGGKVMMPEQTSDGTTSESQGYGLMLSVAMDDKATFQAIWNETKGKLTKGVVNWSWGKNDGTSATDGDEDIAYALYLADKKGWGTKADADALASAIMSNDVSGSTLKLGSNYNVNAFNPSYFAPLAYRSFSGSWSGVIDTGYSTVSKCQQSNGLIADWCKPDGTPASASEVGAQVCGKGMCSDKVYAYEAARAGLRLGQDACWGGGSQASPILTKLLTFFAGKYKSGDSIGQMMAGWLLAQGTPHTSAVANQASFIGPLGVAAQSSSAHAKILDNAFRSTLDILESPQFNRVYYSSSLGLIALLEMSGNLQH
jgi:endo-1,4-beta-D-glucanase Y